MTPGDIVMLLSELGGMSVQATSPSLGAASVPRSGNESLPGRCLPPFGQELSSLGLLEIPPMDLRQGRVFNGGVQLRV